ncbi:MAG: galactokinase family protein [Lachnospiraceae bacterium]|nr:galactokinase family protein [Lachnospiraceae bacterium]
MKLEQALEAVKNEKAEVLLKEMYGDNAAANVERYSHVARSFAERFGEGEFEFFTSPGRTEISGNHTDHNLGKILAGSINLDCVAAAGVSNSNMVHIYSETYDQNIVIDLADLEPGKQKTGTVALLKGILKGFKRAGHEIGGFNAFVTSNVISAAGVSSSASFEMLICCMIDYLFNDNKLTVKDYARIGQFAENAYWDKASGLLDQMACASGGLISIDFNTPDMDVENIDFSFDQIGYDLFIINTGKGHADLSADYSSIPNEMKKVAAFFGKKVLADCSLEELLANLNEVRAYAGDRAVMRAFHFFTENDRVDTAVKALKEKDYDTFLQVITESGNSSWKWLQNCYTISDYNEQSISIALALTEMYLKKLGKGVCRVHGGGFAGVIMAVIPKENSAEYKEYMSSKMGEENVYIMNIRKHGSVHLEF